MTQTFDITKLSFNAYSSCQEKYIILDSGGALGDKCGPLLIKKPTTILDNNSLIAIPGKLTTANLLFKMAYPEMNNIKEILFSDIEHSVLSNNVQAGLIIHENRFTYHAKGLVKELDLGEFWARQTSLPLVGGIVVKRSLPFEVQLQIEGVLRRSHSGIGCCNS